MLCQPRKKRTRPFPCVRRTRARLPQPAFRPVRRIRVWTGGIHQKLYRGAEPCAVRHAEKGRPRGNDLPRTQFRFAPLRGAEKIGRDRIFRRASGTGAALRRGRRITRAGEHRARNRYERIQRDGRSARPKSDQKGVARARAAVCRRRARRGASALAYEGNGDRRACPCRA